VAQAAVAGGWGSAIGAFLGVTLAAGLGWAIFRGGRRVSLPRFFAVTTVLILLLAAGLFSTGVGRLQGLGWLPLTEPLWDTSGLLSDRGLPGSFLGGLVGYRARPTALEVSAFALFVVVAGALVFGVRWPSRASRTGSPEPGPPAEGAAEVYRLPIAPGKPTLTK